MLSPRDDSATPLPHTLGGRGGGFELRPEQPSYSNQSGRKKVNDALLVGYGGSCWHFRCLASLEVEVRRHLATVQTFRQFDHGRHRGHGLSGPRGLRDRRLIGGGVNPPSTYGYS